MMKTDEKHLPSTPDEGARRIWDNGLVLSFLCGICVAVSSLMAKLAVESTRLQINFYRSLMIGCFMITWCSLGSANPCDLLRHLPIRTLAWLFARSMSTFLALSCSLAVYQNISMGDAAAIFGTTPAFTGLMGVILIGEAWQQKHMYLTVLAWSGIVLIYKPQFIWDIVPLDDSLREQSGHQSPNILYMGVALLGSASASLSFTISRKLSSSIPPQLIVGFTFYGTAVYSFLVMTFQHSFGIPPLSDWIYLIPNAILGIVSQTLMGRALKREKAAPVTLMRNSNILASFLLQYAFYGTLPGWTSVVGAGLIILSTAILAIPDDRNHKEKKQ